MKWIIAGAGFVAGILLFRFIFNLMALKRIEGGLVANPGTAPGPAITPNNQNGVSAMTSALGKINWTLRNPQLITNFNLGGSISPTGYSSDTGPKRTVGLGLRDRVDLS